MRGKRLVAALAVLAGAAGCGDDAGSGGSGGGDDTTTSTSGSTTTGSTTTGASTTSSSSSVSTGTMMAECEVAADCDDDDACTTDTCDAGLCANDPVDVDDNDVCTTDSCDPVSGIMHVAVSVDDGNACTADACDPVTGVAHTPIDRADMDLCTVDICDPATGVSNFQTSTLFQEDFADNAAGWTLDTEWAIGSTAASPGGDPAADHSASADNGVAAVGLGADYAGTIHGYSYLTSPAFNGSVAAGQVVLSYWRWLNSDYPNYVTNVVEVFDGTAWQPAWTQPSNGEFILDSPLELSPGQTGGGWQRVDLDVTAFANPTMQIRFGFNVGQAGVVSLGGWTIDDLEVQNRAAGADGDICTTDGCDTQSGSTYTPVIPADNVACTVDSCDPDLGIRHLADNSLCDDGVACTNDSCDPETGCSSTPNNAACNDNVACTTDACGPGGCTNTPDDAACDDGVACTTDTCGAGGCANTPSNAACNDSNVCTIDACGAGGCLYTPVVSPPLGQPHDKCTTGIALLGGNCNGANNQIIANICDQDPYCCNNDWDNICVDEVFDIGNSKVCAASQGTCAHTLCVIGVALAANCDASFGDCVDQICAVDSYCCNNNWDSVCVSEVSSVCGLNCN